jgi:Holliday junction resolvase RusA-like endonuclease
VERQARVSYEITIDGTPKSWNAFINKTHWAYYAYAKSILAQIRLATAQLESRQFQACTLEFIIGYVSRRRSDIDALVVKCHVDALVTCGLLPDDNRYIVQSVSVRWKKTDTPSTTIVIKEVSTVDLPK